MSKKQKRRLLGMAVPKDDLPLNNFLRGFVATGLLTALQDRRRAAPEPLQVLGRAIQGGAALAAGICAANSLQRGECARALGSVVVGTAGIALVECAMNRCEELAEEGVKE